MCSVMCRLSEELMPDPSFGGSSSARRRYTVRITGDLLNADGGGIISRNVGALVQILTASALVRNRRAPPSNSHTNCNREDYRDNASSRDRVVERYLAFERQSRSGRVPVALEPGRGPVIYYAGLAKQGLNVFIVHILH